jgi:hypothetical protein
VQEQSGKLAGRDVEILKADDKSHPRTDNVK